ncbi:GNAT family N-acetyltransferase [Flammeovirga yaeyamensis]|uniref:GNAT family N-acetyltransferase n=1 Tax=Flammeovirga yaeyamensis TaxID=367791 RepID=A0AAX1N3D1_9BACT|nr:GNAT family N-acetyltransferase [Flammeovirga yaeyamensis]MBB3700624.1 ribosomal protein S18 acetylase RimI-like enzyme [Flammeovirga yaeyamensis]NMF37740.1 GNAT family N-acetyltransferase [Flammeovirga yaeyamensis]QWG02049.1 GNAT family N-acetyltransferase [Flammeovirga yaeyamensis]
MLIREIKIEEYNQLEDFLYEAIFQFDPENLIPREVIQLPEVYVFIKDFGSKKDDYCLVAEADNKIVGAVWVRIIDGEIKGFGHIDKHTPEFAISIIPEYRGKGIGTKLMHCMLNYLKQKGYKQASLSVQKENYALRLYQKVGFEIIK